MRQGKGRKIIVFKYKPKKGYHRKQGHRQLFTEMRVDKITGGPRAGRTKKEKGEARPRSRRSERFRERWFRVCPVRKA